MVSILQEQFTAFSLALETANQSIVNRFWFWKLVWKMFTFFRTKFVREIYQSMEQGLTLIGATGIEDRLQDKVCAIFSIFKSTTSRERRWKKVLWLAFSFHDGGTFILSFRLLRLWGIWSKLASRWSNFVIESIIITTIIIIKKVRWLLNWWTTRTINPFHLHQDPA